MPRITRRECLKTTSAGLAACAFPLIAARSGAGHEELKLDGEMVIVPAGNFLMGTSAAVVTQLAQSYGYGTSWFGGESPERTVYVPAFAIMLTAFFVSLAALWQLRLPEPDPPAKGLT